MSAAAPSNSVVGSLTAEWARRPGRRLHRVLADQGLGRLGSNKEITDASEGHRLGYARRHLRTQRVLAVDNADSFRSIAVGTRTSRRRRW